MNQYISSQIANMIIITKNFDQACKMAALKDDGTIDKYEEKLLKKINSINAKYIKDLESLK